MVCTTYKCIVLVLLFSVFPLYAEGERPPSFEEAEIRSNAGFYVLKWTSSGNPVILEESLDPQFSESSVIYSGNDSATAMSGKKNGIYYYRIRNADSPWSESCTAFVEHHPLSRALLFLAAGAFVFLATVLILLRGSGEKEAEDG